MRRFGSPIQGHPAPVPELPWVDVATGSLGQGLAVGLGMALAMRLDGTGGRTFVLLGDSEVAEGSVWEAMEAAAFHEVDDLVAILDMNHLGQRGPTMHGWNGDLFARRAQAYGWRTIEIDGHDVAAIDAAYSEAIAADGPTMIVARTEKGHGVSFVANHEGWHGKAMSPEEAAQAIEELGGIRSLTITPASPPDIKPLTLGELRATPPPAYAEAIPTRKAFGEALAWLAGHRPDLVVLDGEVGNSTHTEDFQAVAPERFVEMYIAEQALVGAQTGLQALGKTAFAATFGAFLTRAYDQVRMGAISRADLRLCGSHAGVSIGEDGPSQMALEDLAMFRALHGSTVLYPADGTATVQLVATMCDLPGISYMRTTREATPALYGADEEFPIGGSKTLRSGDAATIVAARSHGAREPRGRRLPRRRRHRGPRDRRVQREADRRCDVATGARADRRDRGRRGPPGGRWTRRRRARGVGRDRPAHRPGRQGRGARHAGFGDAGRDASVGGYRRGLDPARVRDFPRVRTANAPRPGTDQARSALVTCIAAPGTPPKA